MVSATSPEGPTTGTDEETGLDEELCVDNEGTEKKRNPRNRNIHKFEEAMAKTLGILYTKPMTLQNIATMIANYSMQKRMMKQQVLCEASGEEITVFGRKLYLYHDSVEVRVSKVLTRFRVIDNSGPLLQHLPCSKMLPPKNTIF